MLSGEKPVIDLISGMTVCRGMPVVLGNIIEEAMTLMYIGDLLVNKNEINRAVDFYLEAQGLAIETPSLFDNIRKKLNLCLGK